MVIEESHEKYELTKEDIKNYFNLAIEQCPERAIELYIKAVKVYENKIEIILNYTINSTSTATPIIKKVFTKKYTTERKYKGNNKIKHKKI